MHILLITIYIIDIYVGKQIQTVKILIDGKGSHGQTTDQTEYINRKYNYHSTNEPFSKSLKQCT